MIISRLAVSWRIALKVAPAILLAALPIEAVAMSFEKRLLQDPLAEECTIAVLSGSATVDGRPLLWKNRDTGQPPNEVVYFDDGRYPCLALVTAGETSTAWLGINAAGFAICNALSYNIPDSSQTGITNGALMKMALQRCATIADFESLLVETGSLGRQHPANLGVIDAAGGAAMFEVGSFSFARFDARDSADGLLVRANFSLGPDTTAVSDKWRFHRAGMLVRADVQAGGESVGGLLRVARDLRSVDLDPYPLPFIGSPPGYPDAGGHVDTEETINRRYTVSAGIVTGVAPGEDPRLATFYALLGQPVLTAAVPLWVAAGSPPREVDGPSTSPICDLATKRAAVCFDIPRHGGLLNTHPLVEGDQQSFLRLAEAIEDWLLPETAGLLEHWRHTSASLLEMRLAEYSIARRMFEAESGTVPEQTARLTLMPNPTRGGALIVFPASQGSQGSASIDVFDILGRRVASIGPALPSDLSPLGVEGSSGWSFWDGRTSGGRQAPPGVYYLSKPGGGGRATGRLVVVR